MKLLINPKQRDISLSGFPEVKYSPSGDYQRSAKIQRYVKYKNGKRLKLTILSDFDHIKLLSLGGKHIESNVQGYALIVIERKQGRISIIFLSKGKTWNKDEKENNKEETRKEKETEKYLRYDT